MNFLMYSTDHEVNLRTLLMTKLLCLSKTVCWAQSLFYLENLWSCEQFSILFEKPECSPCHATSKDLSPCYSFWTIIFFQVLSFSRPLEIPGKQVLIKKIRVSKLAKLFNEIAALAILCLAAAELTTAWTLGHSFFSWSGHFYSETPRQN